MEIKKYPDGTSYVTGTGIGVEGSVFKINSYEDLWHLHQVVDAYTSQFKGHKPTITIPNLIDAQVDRRFNKGESYGLKLVCEFLNKMSANFKIFHPHNPEVVEALMDNVEIIDNSEFINTILNDYMHMDAIPHPKNPVEPSDSLILMSSDAGGFKPLMKLCDNIKWKGQTASASKSRTWDGEKSNLVQQIQCDDFEGKGILIVDDICVYGGTFKGLSNLLRQRNCGKLYLAISHMTVKHLGEDPVTNYFDKVFTTNSKHDEYYYTESDVYSTIDKNKLQVIKLF